MRAGSLRRAASRRGSSDCVGRLRRAAARRAQQTACRPDTGSCSWSGVTGDRARPGSNFLAISAGEGEGGWFPAPQPRIVGGGATPGAGEVFRIFERSFHLNIIWVHSRFYILKQRFGVRPLFCDFWPKMARSGKKTRPTGIGLRNETRRRRLETFWARNHKTGGGHQSAA